MGCPFISAYLKGEEVKVVTADHIDRMAKASSISDALAAISGTDVGDYLEGVAVKTFDDLDEALWKYLEECLVFIESFKSLPHDMQKILRNYVAKYDVSNVKAVLQGTVSGKEARMIPIGLIHSYGLLEELSACKNLDSIIELLTECELGSYTSILKEYEVDGGVKPSLLTGAKLDGVYYKGLLDVVRDTEDGSIATRAFGTIIDVMNLKVVLRAVINGVGVEATDSIIDGGYLLSGEVVRELLALKLTDIASHPGNALYRDVIEEVVSSYEKTKSITVVEEIIDKHKFSLSKELLSAKVLSPLALLWYLILKEAEIRDLRLILKAMFDNTPLEQIKMYLVLT